MGGPTIYSQSCGDHSSMLYMRSGNGDMSDLGRRFVDCFVLAADDAALPELAMPRWSWDGLQSSKPVA
jgi:hemoglobin